MKRELTSMATATALRLSRRAQGAVPYRAFVSSFRSSVLTRTAAAAASGRFSNLPPFLSFLSPKLFSTAGSGEEGEIGIGDETEGDEWSDDGWEEEEVVEPKLGDGGDGGGVVLGDVAWGARALSLAREVLENFDEDTVLFSFKVSPKGYVYVRLDKLTNKYGCPDVEEMEKFSNLYKERLDAVGRSGEIPDNLALEVSSPGAERLLKVPEDLDRFKEMPMWVYFLEEIHDSKHQQQSGKVLMLEGIDSESQHCVWKLANVRENRESLGKGRPLNRKQKDWRLTLTFPSIQKVMLYLDSK